MLEVRDLCVTYGKHRALTEASIRVAQGEIVAVLGANGAGKSTLLRTIAGVCEGEVRGDMSLAGADLVALPPDQIVALGIALVPEGRGIFGDLTVRENLQLGAYKAQARAQEAENLPRVLRLFPKLRARQHQIARTMSGGEQQMVAIGRALMSAPQILMLDEPSLGLSPLLCQELFANLRAVKDLGIGILLVEQNAKQSLAIADRGYLLENARIVHEDRAENLARNAAVQRAYLGGSADSPNATATARPGTRRAAHETKEPVVGEGPLMLAPSPEVPTRRSADDQIGGDLEAFVEAAARVSQSHVGIDAPKMRPDTKVSQDPSDDLARVAQDMAAAASAARARRAAQGQRSAERGMSARLSHAAPSSGPNPADASEAVPRIEIYRRPVVEVYRRQGNGAFAKA